jgi:hypothetical protein
MLVNNLEADSGMWDTDPEDDSAWCEVEIVDMEGPAGPNRVLKIAYDLDSDTERVPKNGFWTKLGNLDASRFDHLEFDVRGDESAGFTSTFLVEIKKYKNAERIEKLRGSALIKNVSAEWQTLRIPLNKMTGILEFTDPETWKDPSVGRRDIDELVIVLEGRRVDRKTGVLYFDNIRFVRTGEPGPTAVDFPPRKAGEKTPTKLEGVEFMKFLAQRLRGFPKTVSVKKEFPADDRAFLMEVARDTWRFFDEIVDREHELPLDTIQLGEKEPFGEGGFVGDYTNVTNIGVYLMCLVAAFDLGFLEREECVRRVSATLDTVAKLEHHGPSGFLYNYYDTTTLERTSYFVSFVDSGWLAAGLYVVRNAFPTEIGAKADTLLGRGSFAFFYDPVEEQMFHGFYEHLEVYSDYHYGVFFTEPRAISAMAIARGEAVEEHWFRMVRTFPENYYWQEQEPQSRVPRTTLGYEYDGGRYQWKDLTYVPSWGGSMFEALMPTLIWDEKNLAPRGLGANGERHVRGQIRYATEELQYPVWGMSPSAVPEGGYSEFGAEPFGAKGYKAGVVTPHASFLALEYAPREAAANLRKLAELYDIYGEYGYYDAVRVETGLVARKYLCLDQAMSFIALANHLAEGAVRKRFQANEIFRKVEPLFREEEFYAAEGEPAG